jgi:hypothetical protein
MSDDQKINTVCDLMVQQLMQKQVQWGYINSILTAMVCRKPPDYKSALGLLTPLRCKSTSCITTFSWVNFKKYFLKMN